VAAEDDGVRVVVLGSADRVVCSRAELSEAADGGIATGAVDLVVELRLILAHPKPVVARVVGPVRAGDLGISGASGVVICGDDLTLGELRLGLAPAMIPLTPLPLLTSRAASDTFLTGRTSSAAAAEAMGLVTPAAPASDVAESEACAELLKAHPQGSRETKNMLPRDVLGYLDENSGRDGRPEFPSSSRLTLHVRRCWPS